MNFSIYIKTDSIEPQIKKAIEEFAKRLSRYCKINYTLIKDEIVAQKLLRKNTHCIAISTEGDTISSEAFAKQLDAYGIQGIPDISFFIHCLPADTPVDNLTLSHMDFSPSVQTMILYEQIYRSFRILRGEPYHK